MTQRYYPLPYPHSSRLLNWEPDEPEQPKIKETKKMKKKKPKYVVTYLSGENAHLCSTLKECKGIAADYLRDLINDDDDKVVIAEIIYLAEAPSIVKLTPF